MTIAWWTSRSIAAALVNGLTIVSRNVRDMERTGARLFNPFDG
jgi:predicted nucleic acid-binding protein